MARLVIRRTPAGFYVQNMPDGAQSVQTFYHSWSAFHPETEIFQRTGD